MVSGTGAGGGPVCRSRWGARGSEGRSCSGPGAAQVRCTRRDTGRRGHRRVVAPVSGTVHQCQWPGDSCLSRDADRSGPPVTGLWSVGGPWPERRVAFVATCRQAAQTGSCSAHGQTGSCQTIQDNVGISALMHASGRKPDDNVAAWNAIDTLNHR